MLDIFKMPSYNNKADRDGRLAQLVAHPLDVREVTSSSLVSSTMKSELKSSDFFCSRRINRVFCVKKVWRGKPGLFLPLFYPYFTLIFPAAPKRFG